MRDYLAYYSRIFNAVEVDSTFYGAPKADTVRRWAAVTPEAFKFSVKVPRAITHDLKLQGAGSLMNEFIAAMRLLEDKLGVVLLQFPPSFTVGEFSTLAAFLGDLPDDLRYAVEVRHKSWHAAGEATAEMLRRYGVCWAATEYPGLPGTIHLTSNFVYIRWIGRHGAFDHHDHERVDRTAELEGWRQRMQEAIAGVDEVFGFFNNDYAGFAAGTANRFKEIAGLPVEPFTPPQQGRLL